MRVAAANLTPADVELTLREEADQRKQILGYVRQAGQGGIVSYCAKRYLKGASGRAEMEIIIREEWPSVLRSGYRG